jgi:hypothetical protein
MRNLNVVLMLIVVLMLGLGLPRIPSAVAGTAGMPPCSEAVHASYTTTGPDGKTYPTWHPHFDLNYGCYHSHEHGSNPDMFLAFYRPAYGYTASKHGMAEPHVGFKNYVFDDGLGRRWLIVHHFGTSGLARVCERFHSVDIAVVKSSGGPLLADVHFLGDFGRAEASRSGKVLTPAACPNQGDAVRLLRGRGNRRIPVQEEGPLTYEPWRMDRHPLPGIGFVNEYGLVLNTRHPIVVCNDLTCSQAVPTKAGHGNIRTLNIVGTFGFPRRPPDDPSSGTFYTDPLGHMVMAPDDPHAIKQYVVPDQDLTIPRDPERPVRHCSPVDPLSMLYQCYFDTAVVIPTRPYLLNRWISETN